MLQLLFVLMLRFMNSSGGAWLKRMSAAVGVGRVATMSRRLPNAEYIRAERVRICVSALSVLILLSLFASVAAARAESDLHRAVRDCADASRIEDLLNEGADLDARDEDGETPLHLAARRCDNPDTIRTLVAGGADVNARNDQGETPLFRAARRSDGNPAVSVLLDTDGVEVKARDEYWGDRPSCRRGANR